VAFFLNYVPILGPLCGVAILFLVGLLTFDTIRQALLPAGIYLAMHFVEGEAVTPILLARHPTLNPVLVIVTIPFWYWMWGWPVRFWRCRCWRRSRSSVIASGR
jgi:predicted PurR-regulated permease PerM